MKPSEVAGYLAEARASAEQMLLDMIRDPDRQSIYGLLWPRILARHAVTKPELNLIVAKLRRAGILVVADWQPRQRIPTEQSRLHVP